MAIAVIAIHVVRICHGRDSLAGTDNGARPDAPFRDMETAYFVRLCSERSGTTTDPSSTGMSEVRLGILAVAKEEINSGLQDENVSATTPPQPMENTWC